MMLGIIDPVTVLIVLVVAVLCAGGGYAVAYLMTRKTRQTQ